MQKASCKCMNFVHDGHTAVFCWGKDENGKRPKLHERFLAKRGNKVESANVIGDENSDDESFSCLMTTGKQMHLPSEASSWIIESGCTPHITIDKSLFLTYDSHSVPNVKLGNTEKVNVVECCDVILNGRAKSVIRRVKLEDVLHIPSFNYSLLSVKIMERKGIQRMVR